MGQKLTPETARLEAERLLQMALSILDDGESYEAGAHVAHALSILNQSGARNEFKEADVFDTAPPFQPTWGVLVDR